MMRVAIRNAAEACARVSRRRSLSEGCNIHLLTTITEEEQERSASQPQNEPEEHQFQLTRHHNNTQETRSKSESFICTAQGIVFQDTKSQQYQTRLRNLMALAANPNSSKSNALLAQKALRYRNKMMERRRACS
ncbi:hypothetical protein PHYSODRAFT_317554 [Phytophthora sojae]|uniref:Uncharacterized protein n=1 Tax=Phytophthora sojae (strain P6497) TaxID=1094619 RepID=G4ZX45_PHYSP|nr:hypothetical protein PHYSODRAFT_317554 [Phytophthora sojae]EGZ12515.1 hypothetical protein PHYSODRAFT_317554 [Phytophthora sojae]|eukprot:XP_009532848.1 hypothetical protein PHYSODRAFT_317554 [Phytophthora sojae]